MEVADCSSADLGSCKVMKFLLRYPAKREELPVVRLIPKQWNRRAVIWVDPEGKRRCWPQTADFGRAYNDCSTPVTTCSASICSARASSTAMADR